jgi:PAS domain S-box-containing protein
VERLRDLAEREASLLATVIEYLPVGFYMGDFSGITVCNRVGLDLLGFDTFTELQQNVATLAEQIQTRSLETGIRLRPEEEPFARALLGEACTREVAYTHRKTGEEIVVECAAVPIWEKGKIVAALAVNTDLTAQKRTEAALRKSRAALEQQARLFDTVLSSIVDFAYTFDREGRFTYINQALLDLWQKKLADALGKNFFELDYPEELAARLQQQIEIVFRTGQMLKDETPYTGAAGTTGYYEYIFVPVFGNDSQVEIVAGSTRDITERKEMEEALLISEERSRNILESISDAFFALDRDWRFTYVNRQAERLLDRAPGDLLGKVIWEVYPGLKGSEFEQAYLRAANEGITSSVTAFYPDHDRWYEAHVYAAPKGITIYFRNVTEQKRAEEERESHLHHIQALNQRLQRAMKETHHRVKNNLQVISAMIEMQVLEHQEEQTVPLEEFERLKAHVHTLSIVHDLLTLSIKDEEDAQRVSTKAVLEKLLPMLQRTAWKQMVRYSVEEVELTSKQCIALSLVLNELVSNALKHGKKEAEVFFCVEGQSATLSVRDDGKGFPDGFDPKKAANTGLELVGSLVRTDLQGTIVYDNQPQGGGLVTVVFPLPPDEE